MARKVSYTHSGIGHAVTDVLKIPAPEPRATSSPQRAECARSGTWRRSRKRKFVAPDLEARIDRLALQRKNREDTFVDTSPRLPCHEPLQGFVSERELAKGEAALAAKASMGPEALLLSRSALLEMLCPMLFGDDGNRLAFFPPCGGLKDLIAKARVLPGLSCVGANHQHIGPTAQCSSTASP